MQADEIAQLLPGIFQRSLDFQRAQNAAGAPRGNVLAALLGVMETLHEPAEKTLLELHRYFLPDQTDDAFMPFLSQWVDLAWLAEGESHPAASLDQLRLLILKAGELSTQRGTRQGMLRFLRLATGLTGFQIEESQQDAYHILVTYPPKADPRLVAAIVDHLKPAYVTFELCEPLGASSRSGENQ